MTTKYQRLANSHATYLAASDSSRDAFFLLRAERNAEGHISDFSFVDLNAKGAAVLRAPKEEIIGRKLCDLVPVSRTGALFQSYVQVFETGNIVDEEVELKMVEMGARWIRQQVVRTSDGVAITARNITTRKLGEIADRKNRAFLQSLIDNLPLLIYVKSARPRNFGELAIWNKGAEAITGYTPEQMLGNTYARVFPALAPVTQKIDDQVLDQALPVEANYCFRRADGQIRSLRSISLALYDEYDKPEFMLGIAEDISERETAVEQLRIAATVFEHATEAIVISDAEDRIININRAFCELTGFSKEELIGARAADFELAADADVDAAEMIRRAAEHGVWSGEGRQLRKNGETYQCSRNVVCVRDETGRISKYIRIATDITALKDSQALLERAANHDPLTGLPNRRLFGDRLEHALERAHRGNQNVALLFVDLDAFKSVNDTFGHDAGDLLLKEVTARLNSCARVVDTVCRMGGDEFTIVMENSGHLVEPGLLGQRIVDAFSKPFFLGKDAVVAKASIGISIYPADGLQPDVLMRKSGHGHVPRQAVGRGQISVLFRHHEGQDNGQACARARAIHCSRRGAIFYRLSAHGQDDDRCCQWFRSPGALGSRRRNAPAGGLYSNRGSERAHRFHSGSGCCRGLRGHAGVEGNGPVRFFGVGQCLGVPVSARRPAEHGRARVARLRHRACAIRARAHRNRDAR